MAYSTPRTWAVGEIPTAVQLNKYLRDNLNALHDNRYGLAVLQRSPFSGGLPQTYSNIQLDVNKLYLGISVYVSGVIPTGTGLGSMTISWNGTVVGTLSHYFNNLNRRSMSTVCVIGPAIGGSVSNSIVFTNVALCSTDTATVADVTAMGF